MFNSFLIYPILATFLIFPCSGQSAERLVFGLPNKIGVIEPTASTNAQTKLILPLIFEPLVIVNAKQQLETVLAESWKIDSKQSSIIIKIKSGHKFSDGTEVTANDVVDSLRRFCAPTSQASSDLQGLVGCYRKSPADRGEPGIELMSGNSVRLKIKINPTIFFYQLASSRIVITKKNGANLIGSGPYLVKQKTDDFVTLDPNPFYHQKDRIKNTGLILRYVDEKNVADSLHNKPLDGSIMYRISAVTQIHDKNYRVIEDKPIITQLIVLNNQRYPFNQPAVREALAAEIYNEGRVNECIGSSLRAYGVIPVGIGGSIAHQAPSSLPVKSKAALAKPVKISLHQHVGRRSDCESQRVINAAKKLGIEINFIYHDDYATLWPLYLNHNLDGYVELFLFKNREAFSILQYFSDTSAENFANVKDKNLAKLMNDSLKAPSSTARFERYRTMAQYLQDKGVVIPLYYIAHSNLIHKCLGGITDEFYFNPYQRLPELFRIEGCKL